MGNDFLKKKFGKFYTPKEIVSLIVSKINIKPNLKILEPGCGDGRFIEEICMVNKNNNLNIYGIDIDKKNIDILRMKYLKFNFLNESFLSEVYNEEKFDLIIGNPPYATEMSMEEKKYCKENLIPLMGKNNLETSAFFLTKSVFLLRGGGTLSLILPSTLLRVESYKNLRGYLKKETNFLEIINIGRCFEEVGYEMVILTLMKKRKNLKEPTRIKLTNFLEKKENPHFLDYNFFKVHSIIPIWLKKDFIPIIKKIEEDSEDLGNFASMPRGISVSSKDKVFLTSDSNQGKIILRGKDIERYKIRDPKLYLKDNFKIEHKVDKKKILVQNLAYKIVAALDKKGHLTLDTLNNLTIQKQDYLPEYILCILNSKLMEFYLQNVITNRARLNIHLDFPYLGKIPIKKISKGEQEKFIGLLEKGEFDKIEELIFKIYNINDKEKEIIFANRLSKD